MTGFEPGTSSIEIERSVNWATTTAQLQQTKLQYSVTLSVRLLPITKEFDGGSVKKIFWDFWSNHLLDFDQKISRWLQFRGKSA